MRSTLHVKFIILYIIFGFMCVFCVSSFTRELMLNKLEEHYGESLYQEATELCSDYLPFYFSNQITQSDVFLQLSGVHNYLESNIWLVEKDGTTITSFSFSGQKRAPSKIENFNPAEIGGEL